MDIFYGHQAMATRIEHSKRIVDAAQNIGFVVVSSALAENADTDFVLLSGSAPTVEAGHPDVAELSPSIKLLSTLSYEEYASSPFFPVVAKNSNFQVGKHKYLLEDESQWQKMQTFLTCSGPVREIDPQDAEKYEKAKSKLRDLDSSSENFKEQLEYVKEWEDYLHNYQFPSSRPHTDFLKYQHYIETPGDRYTSYRVLVSASGAVLASALNYSGDLKSEPSLHVTPQDVRSMGMVGDNLFDFLTTPGCLTFLGSKRFQSNRAMGGHGIILDPTPNSVPRTLEDNNVLNDHGLDTSYPQLPPTLKEQSSEIGRKLGPTSDVVLGLDWIQDKDTGSWYLLEANVGPDSGTFADTHGIKQGLDAHLAMYQDALRTL
jgi:hypothetical protein